METISYVDKIIRWCTPTKGALGQSPSHTHIHSKIVFPIRFIYKEDKVSF